MNCPPTFPPKIWNQRDAAIEGIARTTNAVESWQYGIQALFSGSHPWIWKLLVNLQKDAAVQKLNILNAPSGHKFPKMKKFENLKGKVQNLMQIYRDETDIHFFRAIASLTKLCIYGVYYFVYVFVLNKNWNPSYFFWVPCAFLASSWSYVELSYRYS